MAASVMTGAISLANSVTAPSNRGSLALPVFFFGKKSVEYCAGQSGHSNACGIDYSSQSDHLMCYLLFESLKRLTSEP